MIGCVLGAERFLFCRRKRRSRQGRLHGPIHGAMNPFRFLPRLQSRFAVTAMKFEVAAGAALRLPAEFATLWKALALLLRRQRYGGQR